MKKICFRIIITSFLLLIVFTGCASTSDSSRPRTLTLSYYMSDEQIDRLIAMAADPGVFADAIESGLPIEDVRELVREYLSEQQISEDMTDEGFTSWHCLDYSGVKNVGLEFGYYSIDGYVSGFLLYDGNDKGIRTFYRRVGLEHHWDWIGPYGGSYSFVISPEERGYYYDFTDVPYGERIKPRDVYNVRKVRKR